MVILFLNCDIYRKHFLNCLDYSTYYIVYAIYTLQQCLGCIPFFLNSVLEDLMGKKGKNYDEKALFDEPDVSISSGS